MKVLKGIHNQFFFFSKWIVIELEYSCKYCCFYFWKIQFNFYISGKKSSRQILQKLDEISQKQINFERQLLSIEAQTTDQGRRMYIKSIKTNVLLLRKKHTDLRKHAIFLRFSCFSENNKTISTLKIIKSLSHF